MACADRIAIALHTLLGFAAILVARATYKAMELFVDRTRESALLQRRLDRESLTIVIGRAGIGKTATLRRALQGQISRWHSVRPGDGAAQTALSLLRGLAPHDAGPAVLGDPASMLADAIDAAERERALVVVDDAHHLDDAEPAALMACLAQKARLERWFVSARHLPPLSERIEDLVALEDSNRASLKRLAAQLDKRLSAGRFVSSLRQRSRLPRTLGKS